MVRRIIVQRTSHVGEKETIMKTLNLLTFILVVVGAINWMLFGVMGVNLISGVFGGVDALLKLVYFLIGLSGIHMLISNYKKVI
jgi:uncharacterized membrane protein YuzA (DUF378 family)